MTSNDETKTEATPGVVVSTGGKFFTLLTSWGVPAVVAAAIIGAAYAALVALGVLALPGCTLTLDVLPDESLHLEGVIEQQQFPGMVTPQK